MTNLDCTVINCAYNHDKSCRLREIDVMGDNAHLASETCCGSFRCKGDDCCSTNTANAACKETDVCCSAVECRFNDDKKCSAKHIGIAGGHADSSRETECASFECCH